MIAPFYTIKLNPSNFPQRYISHIHVQTSFSDYHCNYLSLNIEFSEKSKVAEIYRDVISLIGETDGVRLSFQDKTRSTLVGIYIQPNKAQESVQALNTSLIMCNADYIYLSDAVNKMLFAFSYAKMRVWEITPSQKDFLIRRINKHARIIFLHSLNKTDALKWVDNCSFHIRNGTTRADLPRYLHYLGDYNLYKNLPQCLPNAPSSIFYDALYELGKLYCSRANLEESLVENKRLPQESLIQGLVKEVFNAFT